MRYCTVTNCGKKSHARGYCDKHYSQLLRNGQILTATRKDKRPAIIEGNIAKIPLGVSAKDGYAIVDKEFAYLAENNWRLTHWGYAIRSIDKKLLHRVLLDAKVGVEVDHKNRNTLDNRMSNIRIATSSQNGCNRVTKISMTGFKGVSELRQGGRYRAKIQAKNKKYELGIFTSVLEAAKAYDKAAKKLHGEFARLNFV